MARVSWNNTAIAKELQGMEAQLDKIAFNMARNLAYEVRDKIKRRLPPDGSETLGMPNTFPGYAATGQLRRWIHARQPVRGVNGQYRALVGLGAHAPDKVRMRFMVHEFGKVIHAKPGGYLTFRVQGKWVRVRQVRIREKRFYRSAFEDSARMWRDMIYRNVIMFWPRR